MIQPLYILVLPSTIQTPRMENTTHKYAVSLHYRQNKTTQHTAYMHAAYKAAAATRHSLDNDIYIALVHDNTTDLDTESFHPANNQLRPSAHKPTQTHIIIRHFGMRPSTVSIYHPPVTDILVPTVPRWG